jgi:hypothetical protein
MKVLHAIRCRKLASEFIERAQADWDFDPDRSVLVGDAAAELETAAAAGIRSIRFQGGVCYARGLIRELAARGVRLVVVADDELAGCEEVQGGTRGGSPDLATQSTQLVDRGPVMRSDRDDRFAGMRNAQQTRFAHGRCLLE